MSSDLPEFYFRIRDKGAVVFRVDTENRQRRIEMDQIAVVNVVNGQIKPHGQRELLPDELEAIEGWMAQRVRVLDDRTVDDIHRAIDHLNLTAQWVQTTASDAQLEEFTDELLLAMHDLRSLLVRKKADRLLKSREQAAE
ncbi:MAG: hypothetical protein MK180_01960 [Rhodobacteraceae bacterium]|nr:hypothetical protein [Paracoccaceae bacterium]